MLLKREEQAVFALRELYARRGYRPYKMSRFEEYDLYVRYKEFLSSGQVITFPARDGRLLALKPDVTLSIVKNAPEKPGVVEKLYYNESVYRADSATGDIRELTQAGLECVGDLQPYDVAEVVLLAVESLSILGVTSILDISHVGLLQSVLSRLPAGLREEAQQCLQQKNVHELKALCAQCDDCTVKKLTALIEYAGCAEEVLPKLNAVMDQPAEQQALTELSQVLAILKNRNLDHLVRVDFSLGGSMAYYNGLVFRGYLPGIPEAVLSGGQYDRLPVGMGKNSRAIGFAVYMDLLERLEEGIDAFDVDTVIICKAGEDPVLVDEAAAALAEGGRVLICTQIPEGCRAREIYEFMDGEAKKQDGNG